MVQINFALKEVNCKVVYYGPGLSGKTTNLEVVHSKAPTSNVGELTSIATEGDRTLFFDFLPLNLGSVAGMTTKFQIYTVPGQVYYNSTRKLVLQGADGIVFVADSRRGKMDENFESFSNLEVNLKEYGMDIKSIPLVMQYNKRDLPDVYSIEELEQKLNKYNGPYFEAVAVTGEGVFPTLKKLSQMVLESLNRQQGSVAVKPPRRTVEGKEQFASPPSAPAKVRAGAPVAVAAGSQFSGPRAPTAARGGAAPAVATLPPQTQRGGRPGDKASVRVLKEAVSDSPGVKQIERKTPGGEPAVRKRPAAQPAAPEQQGCPKRVALIIAITAAAIAVIGAALYLSGVLG